MSDGINDENEKEDEAFQNVKLNTGEESDATESESDLSHPHPKHNKYKILSVILAVFLVISVLFVVLLTTGTIKIKGKGGNKSSVSADNREEETTLAVLDGSDAKTTEAESTEKPAETISETGQTHSEDESQDDTDAKSATFTVDFAVANSWGADGAMNYQFNVSVRNTSKVDIKSWGPVEVDVPDGTSVTQAWGCEYEVNGTTLTIKPVDYTSEVPAGAVRGDIGLIITSSGKMENFSCDGTTDSVARPAASSGTDDGNDTQSEASASSTPVSPYEPPEIEAGTPVGNHGQLSVNGTDLVDANGEKYQLKGVSTHGIGWFPDYVNEDGFKTLRDNWGANLVRIAMYTDEYNGYCSGGNKDELEALVCKGVEACTDLGMYVIVDWHVLHDLDPNKNIESAKVFFDRMSKKYSDNVNVIYEICNEPNGGTTWADIKKYADTIIPIIRANSPDAVIIVGTPTWSQDVDQVASDPLVNSENVMYALHFYAATHKDELRNKLTDAIAAGTPVFISEFSICDASGNGGVDYDSAEKWKELINSNNLSYAGWSLSNKAETSALINPSCTKLSDWDTNDLSSTGQWLRDMISGK